MSSAPHLRMEIKQFEDANAANMANMKPLTYADTQLAKRQTFPLI